MKKSVLVIAICLVCSICAYGQTGEAIYSISGNNIVTKSKFIDPFFVDNSTTLTPYVLKTTTTLIPSSSYGSFSLKLLKFNGYESEPGICNVVQIFKNGTQVLQLLSSNGFRNMSSYINTETGEYTFVNLATDTYALVFNEWIYASQPSMVSIILFYKGQATLVYNKPMFINSLTKQTGILSMVLQADTSEYVDSDTVPVNPPDLHTLWWDGSVLRFQ
jgi:hypothetical protein